MSPQKIAAALPAQTPGGTKRRNSTWRKAWPIYPALLFLAILFVYPIVVLLSMSFASDAGVAGFEQYSRLLSSPVYAKVLAITFKTAGWTTVIAMIAGYPVAYLIATARPSIYKLLIVLVLMPFWTSFLVRIFAWMVLLGRHGAINDLLTALGIVDAPISMIYNFTGVLIGMVHAMMPLCVLTMLSVMEKIDGNLMKAASTLGARKGSIFWKIYFPLSLSGVAAGGLLVFITSLGFFMTPALLGGAGETMIVQEIIFQVQNMLNWRFAGAVSVLLLVSALIVFVIYDALLGLSTLSGESGGARANLIGRISSQVGGQILSVLAWIFDSAGALFDKMMPARGDKPRKQQGARLLWIGGLAAIGFLVLPALFVVPISFTQDSFLSWPPNGFTLKWYQAVFADGRWGGAAGRSFIVALLAAAGGTLIGVPAAFFLVRQRMAGKTALLAFLMAPMILPHIIVAVALFYVFSQIGLIGTTFGLVLGHTVLTIPYVVITVMAVIKGYDIRLDHAAWTLGASRVKTFWHITIPVLKSGLIAAFMFAFITSFDELTIALFLTGGEITTLPKLMWDDALLKVSPMLAAVATLLLAFMTVLILASAGLQRRGRKPA
ncbi:MAG TPA: ABC transporter permease subunit [Noviherbaspirillum sp.]|nr:ABC transporter permease subunit [Noviherbaspirillum sp.]